MSRVAQAEARLVRNGTAFVASSKVARELWDRSLEAEVKVEVRVVRNGFRFSMEAKS